MGTSVVSHDLAPPLIIKFQYHFVSNFERTRALVTNMDNITTSNSNVLDTELNRLRDNSLITPYKNIMPIWHLISLLGHVSFIENLATLFCIEASFVKQKPTVLASLDLIYKLLVSPQSHHFSSARTEL